jgi:hypothetical protein
VAGHLKGFLLSKEEEKIVRSKSGLTKKRENYKKIGRSLIRREERKKKQKNNCSFGKK